MKKIHLYKEPNLIAKFNAFPYQRDAFEAVKDLEYAAIFHEQGLGKTKIAIDLLLYWLKDTDIDSVLVVTKKQLVQNWVREFKTHTSLRPAVLDTNRGNNYLVFCGPARVVITNFEMMVSEKERFKLYLKTRNVAVIIDESTKLKNPKAKLSLVFFELSSLFKKRVIMTGTPIANRPYDIWSQIYFLDHGKSLGADFNEFKKETDLSNKLATNEEIQQQFEDEVSAIYEKINKFSVRETKNSEIVELPDKIYIQERVNFLPEQEEFYNRICEDLMVQVKQGGEFVIDDSSSIVKRLLRLVQVTSNPKLIDESYEGKSAKEEILDSLILKIIEAGEKCIVWSNFIENIDYFAKKYKNYGSMKIHGKMNINDRNRSVEKFRANESKILFAPPMSAKEGLTLTVANHVIFYDRGFSLDDYLQAQDRIHRISQTKTCYIHNIIVSGSIDEWIDVLLGSKQKAAALAQGDVTLTQYKETADYSFGDLIKIILFPDEYMN
jgi:SNF2 family DNA or RNA helicase